MEWTRAAFEKFYNIGYPHGTPAHQGQIRTHYNNWVIGDGQRDRAPRWAVALENRSPLLVVGSGFNWTAEGLQSIGFDVVGIDTSAYITDNAAVSEEAELRDYIAAAGVDPDTDTIIAPPFHPLSTRTVPAWKQAFYDAYVASPEGIARKQQCDEWAAMSDAAKDAFRRDHGQPRYDPKWQTAPKPEFIARPLDILMPGDPTVAWEARTDKQRTKLMPLAEDGATSGSRTNIAARVSGFFKAILTEEVLNAVDDAAALQVCAMADQVATDKGDGCLVFHGLSSLQSGVTQAAELNWKTYDDWRSFLDGNGFSHHRLICTVADGNRQQYEVM